MRLEPEHQPAERGRVDTRADRRHSMPDPGRSELAARAAARQRAQAQGHAVPALQGRGRGAQAAQGSRAAVGRASGT